MLIWLQDKIRANHIDCIISAELPDATKHFEFFEVMKNKAVHGPSALSTGALFAWLMEKAVKANIRNSFPAETGHDEYPRYRYRKPGHGAYKTIITANKGRKTEIDNGWIVPFSQNSSKRTSMLSFVAP